MLEKIKKLFRTKKDQEKFDPEFEYGEFYIFENVPTYVEKEELDEALTRHLKCDWGDIPEEGKELNEQALKNGGDLYSSYHTKRGKKFWIKTEGDRSQTVAFMHPEED